MPETFSFLHYSLLVAMVVALTLALLLLLISVPRTEYAKRLHDTKNTIAICYMACALTFWFIVHHAGIEHFEFFASTMMLIVTAVSASALSYSLINLLDEKLFDYTRFLLSEAVACVLGVLLAWTLTAPGPISLLGKTVFVVTIVLHVLQCVAHIITFSRVFKECQTELDNYYDEDQDAKLRWIRFCYAIMMLTEMFILVYLLLPKSLLCIYIIGYVVFMLYFTANFISFLGRHKLLLDAFAYGTLSGRDLKLPKFLTRQSGRKHRKAKAGKAVVSEDTKARDKEFARLEKYLDKWVAEKRYRELDKSRQEIADQLHTSKELLSLYFAARMGEDFRTWRTRLRIEDAKQMLLEDRNASVNLVSERCGFSDRSNFHRQFTTLVGCSPKEWRDSSGKKEQE